MTTLTVVVDELAGDAPGDAGPPNGLSRFELELTRQLIATAPPGCEVRAVVPRIPDERLAELRRQLPGISDVIRLPIARRELAVAWQSGISVSGVRGMVHAPSLLAPLRRHDTASGDQTTVTIRDTLAWTHPESLGTTRALWAKTMAKRARRYADAIIVPTHAVAGRLAGALNVGDRIRVIGGAPIGLRVPADADERARRLALPEMYALTPGAALSPVEGLASLIRAVARPEAHRIPLLIAGPDRYGDSTAAGVAAAAGLPEDHVRALGSLDDSDLAVVLDRATVFVEPGVAEGFGLPVMEALAFGLPIIHSDDPALVEIVGGASLTVEHPSTHDGDADYSELLADAIGRVLDDSDLRSRLGVLAADRSRAFSWRDSAEQIWQLHADL